MATELLEYNFQFNRDNFKNIIDCIKDLCKINTMIKIKFDKEHVLFYSRAGNENYIPAFKSFLFDIDEFIITDDKIVLDFIIIDGLKFVKNLELFEKKETDMFGKITYKEKDKIGNIFYIYDNNLKLNFITGDYRQIKDITKEQIESKMNPDFANFNFEMTDDQFTELKKLTTLNKSEILSIKIKKNKLSFYDKRLTLKICDINYDDEIISFSNKYLKSINSTSIIKVYVFEQFILIKDQNTNLMIGLELSDLK